MVIGRWRRAVPVAVAALVLAPAFGDPGSDSYPLSSYPMFSTDRPARADLATVVGVNAAGEAVRLSPELIAGADEPILAAATVSGSIRTGQSDRLCAEVADRVRAAGLDVAEVSVRTEHVDVVAHVAEGTDPLAVTIHARCPVTPPATPTPTP